MSFKHDFTKDAWNVVENGNKYLDIVTSEGKEIAWMAWIGAKSDIPTKEREANVKLISAAPELLQCTEMLHDMLLNEGKNSIAMKAVKMALKKSGIKIEDIKKR